MKGIFSPPHPFMKPKPPRYPKWEDPERDPPNKGTYRMSAPDLNISLEDSMKTKNFAEILACLVRSSISGGPP